MFYSAGLKQSADQLLSRAELVFAYGAEWTFEVVGEFFERGARFDTCFGYSYFGIILPAAYVTYILLHKIKELVRD